MRVEELAKALYEQLSQDGWTVINVPTLKAVAESEGKDASLLDDDYSLKSALSNVLKKFDLLSR